MFKVTSLANDLWNFRTTRTVQIFPDWKSEIIHSVQCLTLLQPWQFNLNDSKIWLHKKLHCMESIGYYYWEKGMKNASLIYFYLKSFDYCGKCFLWDLLLHHGTQNKLLHLSYKTEWLILYIKWISLEVLMKDDVWLDIGMIDGFLERLINNLFATWSSVEDITQNLSKFCIYESCRFKFKWHQFFLPSIYFRKHFPGF